MIGNRNSSSGKLRATPSTSRSGYSRPPSTSANRCQNPMARNPRGKRFNVAGLPAARARLSPSRRYRREPGTGRHRSRLFLRTLDSAMRMIQESSGCETCCELRRRNWNLSPTPKYDQEKNLMTEANERQPPGRRTTPAKGPRQAVPHLPCLIFLALRMISPRRGLGVSVVANQTVFASSVASSR